MASKSRHIYTGVTNDIERRVAEHKEGRIEGFTRRYNINRLVYKERFRYVGNAIEREKEIKGWDRQKRVALIEAVNPTWEDLSLEWGTPIEMLSPAAADEKQIPRSSTPTRAKSALAGDPGCARDDNSFGANSVNERATEQQIPRELKLARDDNCYQTR